MPRQLEKPLKDWTLEEAMLVHRQLGRMREASVKAQVNFSRALQVEEGDTQRALVSEFLGFIDDAAAEFEKLSKLAGG